MAMTSAATSYFEQVANRWDDLRAGYFTEAVREAALAKAYLRPEMVVADVGAGAGFMAAGLAPLVKRVIAVDGSAAMIEAARRALSAFDNVEFEVADGATLPFADGSLDAVFANMYLHHCPDPQAAIAEMVRVLRPGGRLVIADLDQHDHVWMRQEMADEWLGFDRKQVKAWLRAAGLVNLIVDGTGQSCCAASTAGAERAEVSVFVATGTRRIAGAREAVQTNYGALAAGASCCEAGQEAQTSCCSSSSEVLPASCCAAGPLAQPGACCSSEGGAQELVFFDAGYRPEQIAAVPAEAATLSLGCGNPTALASLRPGEVVLDIGSGAGIDAFYAAQRVGAQGRVIGLDMTPEMIERARRAAAAAGFTQVEFRLGQAEDMPVEDNSVDVILSNCVINLVEDKGRVFEEAYRVLKEGGRLSISDVVTAGPLPIEVRGDMAGWAGCVNGALPEQEYLDLVRQAGFTEITAQRTLSSGQIAGVPVYSLAVSARKRSRTR
jgi:arsenite methyltransferase